MSNLNTMSNIRFLTSRISFNTFILTHSSSSNSITYGKFFNYQQFNDSLRQIYFDAQALESLGNSIFLDPSIPFSKEVNNLYYYPSIPLYSIHDASGNITYPSSNYRLWYIF